jgi:phospholipid N-methyltransferase
LLFARNFLRYPDLVGWVLPSRSYVVNHVLGQVDWERCRTIVEYGPGVGTFTEPILARMHPEARLIALEVNRSFVQYLRETLHDPRCQVVHRSAADVQEVLREAGLNAADCVVSGIPFKTIRDPLRREIVHTTHRVLRPGGMFLVYQLSEKVEPYLREVFPQVTRRVEPRSLVPSRTFCCRR